VCGVADGKNFGMCGYRQVWSDHNLSGLICFHFQPAPGGRGEDTRSPEDGGGFNSLLANNNSFGIDACDAGIGVDLNAQTLQVALRFDGKVFRIGG